jgi:hypothetical protein
MIEQEYRIPNGHSIAGLVLGVLSLPHAVALILEKYLMLGVSFTMSFSMPPLLYIFPFGILFPFLGLVFSYAGLAAARKHELLSGKTMAITGLIISGASALFRFNEAVIAYVAL